MTVKPANGSLIIAPPGMIDGRFARTVNLITNHNQEGTFALCVNRPTPHTLEDLAKELRLDLQNLRFHSIGAALYKRAVYGCYTLLNGRTSIQCTLMSIGELLATKACFIA